MRADEACALYERIQDRQAETEEIAIPCDELRHTVFDTQCDNVGVVDHVAPGTRRFDSVRRPHNSAICHGVKQAVAIQHIDARQRLRFPAFELKPVGRSASP